MTLFSESGSGNLGPQNIKTDLKAETLIIGGGITGVTVALELQKSGQQVTLLDQSDIGRACSLGNAGWVTPCFAMPLPQPGMFLKSIGWLFDPTSPLHIQPRLDPTLFRWLTHFLLAMNHKKMASSIEVLTALSKYSLDFYRSLASRASGLDFQTKGLLMVSANHAGVQGAIREMEFMAEQGIPGKAMSREELLAFEPTLKPKVQGGVFFPDEAQIDPLKVTLAIAEEFKRLGGKILEHHEVFDFELSEGSERRIRALYTTQGKIEADLIVLATGSWSLALTKKLRCSIPVLGGKGYSMSFQNVTQKPERSIMLVDRKIAITPFSDRLRVAGTLELVNQDFSISPVRLEAVRAGAHEYINFGGGELTAPREIWRGLRPCTPDGVPVVGFSTQWKNLFYCTGHQMLGLQSAPGTARLAADLIQGKQPIVDPKPFRAGRFGA
jgi:D-amino-acid dehydrogenase